jgi:hypothetical protein
MYTQQHGNNIRSEYLRRSLVNVLFWKVQMPTPRRKMPPSSTRMFEMRMLHLFFRS